MQFGKCLKLGVHVDSTNCVKVAELLGWDTSKSGDEQVDFEAHIDRMEGSGLSACLFLQSL